MTNQDHFWLFVYGPYMNPKYLDQHGIKYISSRKAILLDYDICFSSTIDNWKLALIDLIKKKGHRLEGVAYEIDSYALQAFDKLEKVFEKEHNRIAVAIISDDGPINKAYTYMCPIKKGSFQPSSEYIELIIEGARLNNLSEEHILHIQSFLKPKNGTG